jgi:glycoside/pentoside/hexuronide:cation symporter, GPH family
VKAGAPAHRIGWGRLIAYGGLQLPLATIGLPLAIYLAPFYAGELGLPLATLGLAMLIARLSDLITDPIIGTISDRWRPAIGRRKVWVPIGISILTLGVWLLFNPPGKAGFGYFLMALALTYFGFTTTRLPYHAWGSELSGSYEERTRITSVRQVFSLAGLIIATLIPAWVLQTKGATAADVLHALSYAMIGSLPVFALILFLGVPDPPVRTEYRPLQWRLALKQLWRNGPFRTVAIVMLLGFIAETFRITITLFFARDIIGVQNIGIIYVYYFLTGLIAVPVWLWLGNRIGKHRAMALAFAIVLCTNIGIFFLSHGQELLFTMLFVGKGFCFGALELIPSSIVADTADVDTVMSKERRQGLLFAVAGMIVNFGQAIGQGLSLNLLALFGYQAAGGNGADALFWLRALYCLFPLVFLLPAMWLAWNYSLTATRHRKFQIYLAIRYPVHGAQD